MWASTGSGIIELNITKNQAHIGYHSGACDSDIAELRTNPKIKSQLNKIDKKVLIEELKEWGAWDDSELADHNQNLNRILWLLCAEIVEKC